jgi:hypothetical protein
MKALSGRRLWALLGALSLGVLCAAADRPNQGAPPPRTFLGLQGSRFTLNGKATFLYGISYYGALGAPEEFIRRDLDEIQRYGFNWVRVWATWAGFNHNVAALDPDGRPREPWLGKLRWLVAECDRRGLVVDVTLSRGNGVAGAPKLQDHAQHALAVETVVTALAPWQNWYLDLSNERNIRDQRFTSFDELRALRALVRQRDPRRLVTSSHAGDVSRDEVRRYLLEAQVDFLAPHRPRDAGSPTQTQAKSREYLAWMKDLGREVPLHYQEPFRRGYGAWQPAAGDFLTDLRGAQQGDAAGWCFHNGDTRARPDGEPRRSFDLRRRRLFEQLDAEELKALEGLAQAVKK